MSGSAAVGCWSVYAGTRNSRSRRGDSVAFVAREREARDSVYIVRVRRESGLESEGGAGAVIVSTSFN